MIINLCFHKVIHEAELSEILPFCQRREDWSMGGWGDTSGWSWYKHMMWCFCFTGRGHYWFWYNTKKKKKYLVPFAQLLLITLQIESLKAETWELHGCIMIHMFWCNVGHADWRALRPPAQTSAWTISVIPRSNVWSCEGILGYRM